jgi:hypothetical protein
MDAKEAVNHTGLPTDASSVLQISGSETSTYQHKLPQVRPEHR